MVLMPSVSVKGILNLGYWQVIILGINKHPGSEKLNLGYAVDNQHNSNSLSWLCGTLRNRTVDARGQWKQKKDNIGILPGGTMRGRRISLESHKNVILFNRRNTFPPEETHLFQKNHIYSRRNTYSFQKKHISFRRNTFPQ